MARGFVGPRPVVVAERPVSSPSRDSQNIICMRTIIVGVRIRGELAIKDEMYKLSVSVGGGHVATATGTRLGYYCWINPQILA